MASLTCSLPGGEASADPNITENAMLYLKDIRLDTPGVYVLSERDQ
jgi:hypothetical protein